MKADKIKIGMRVKTNRKFFGVPRSTEGVIDEDYGTGFMVAWDGPPHHNRLPANYKIYDGKPSIVTGILRDGFDKSDLHYLEKV